MAMKVRGDLRGHIIFPKRHFTAIVVLPKRHLTELLSHRKKKHHRT